MYEVSKKTILIEHLKPQCITKFPRGMHLYCVPPGFLTSGDISNGDQAHYLVVLSCIFRGKFSYFVFVSICQFYPHTIRTTLLFDIMARFSINLLAITLLGVEALASSAERFTGAVRVEQSLAERASFAGGWALAQTTCPTNAPVQCFKDNTGLNHSCCPSGTTCFENLNIPYCCPTS